MINAAAVKRALNPSGLDLLDGIDGGQSHERRSRGFGSIDHGRNLFGSDERPGRVVHYYDSSAIGVYYLESAIDRILALRSARNNALDLE